MTGTAATKTLTVAAVLNGGGTNFSVGISNNSTAKIIIIGPVNGGIVYFSLGLYNVSTGLWSVIGNVNGGSGNAASGIVNATTGTGAVVGNINGGSGIQAEGISSAAPWTLIGNIADGTKGSAIGGYPPTWTTTTSSTITCVSSLGNTWGVVPAAANLLSGVTCGGVAGIWTPCTAEYGLIPYQWGVNGTSVSGTNVLPATMDVRYGTAVGVSPAVGSLVVPSAGAVAIGTTFDNGTVGTRVDCPVTKALTSSGNYGNPAAWLVGTWVAAANADVRNGTANGVNPSAGTLIVPTAAQVLGGVTFDSTTVGTLKGVPKLWVP
jgi:hypothetical protein